MSTYLTNKHILLGVTGSIAAYKSADLVRRLREEGAIVRVVMTTNAKQFITPLTMQAVSGHPVHDDLFDLQAEAAMGHIELARWADVILVAPASADFIARLVHGNANDLLTSICLATNAPIAVAPAMNQGMWNHTATQANIQALQVKNIHIFGPAAGSQACGDVGFGRMMEPVDLVQKTNELFKSGALAGVRVLITAGPTQEAIDPVRYITNHSSGKMGYALAAAAHEAGAQVTLVSGPVNIKTPHYVQYFPVVTADEMQQAVMNCIPDTEIFLSVAAVGDYRSQTTALQKIHKSSSTIQLTLERNADIVAEVGKLADKPFIVGFAAETENLIESANQKRIKKNMDMIIANHVGKNIAMGTEDNEVTVLWENNAVHFPLANKGKLARELITLIAKQYQQRKLT